MATVVNDKALELWNKWWCSVCQAWRAPIRHQQIGAMCSKCRSGRIRPPREGERVAR